MHIMKLLLSIFLLLAYSNTPFAANDISNKTIKNSINREPFSLKLRIDKEHFYEGKFGETPCSGQLFSDTKIGC